MAHRKKVEVQQGDLSLVKKDPVDFRIQLAELRVQGLNIGLRSKFEQNIQYYIKQQQQQQVIRKYYFFVNLIVWKID